MVLLAAAILAVLTAVPLFATAAAENFEWPKAGFVTGSRVNLRNGPSTSAKVVGRFGHDYETGELVVTGTEKTGEEFPWYRVFSHQFGEGWIYGKFLSVEETDSTVRRYVMKIREDFGISPALAVKMYGEPMKREERKVKLPDFNTTVHIVDLFFHGHNAWAWMPARLSPGLGLRRKRSPRSVIFTSTNGMKSISCSTGPRRMEAAG
jgi:hypothetical protein